MIPRQLRGLLCALSIAGAACDGPGVAGPAGGRVARVGGANPVLALVGSWRRVIFFLDDFNYARSSETTFQFNTDGSVVRVQVARNHTLGLADVVVSTGLWRMDGAKVVLDFVTPTKFQLSLDARIVGDQLELAGQTYLRVSN